MLCVYMEICKVFPLTPVALDPCNPLSYAGPGPPGSVGLGDFEHELGSSKPPRPGALELLLLAPSR